MRRPRTIVLAVLVIALAVVIIVVAPRFYRGQPVATPAQPAAAPAAVPERKITATLFYIGEDGLSLTPVQREVTFGEPVSEQARYIVDAQIAAAPPPHASAIPLGTRLRAVFVTEQGDAFVDLTADITKNHTGGTLNEFLSVYAIVNAVTVNLPAIKRVQLLVDGKEVDTLAGHVDLRQPLGKNLAWVVKQE